MLTTFLWVECHLGKDPLVSHFLRGTLRLCLPPFQNADKERHNLLCPVRALDAYVHRAALWLKNLKFFVCFGPPNYGWLDTIILASV